MNDDRLASLRNQVSRDPLVRGGTCLISHRLNSSRPERWEFRLSASYRWTTGILIGLGGVICGFAIAAGEGWAGERLFPIVLGGLFLLFGLSHVSQAAAGLCSTSKADTTGETGAIRERAK